MKNITVIRGNDGFGSQLFSIISGLAYAEHHKFNYLHTPIQAIKLLHKPEFKNSDLEKANLLINRIIYKLGYDLNNESINCEKRPFYHDIIYNENKDDYFNEKFLHKLKKSYDLSRPEFFNKDDLNICIHIRRGQDIFNKSDIEARIVSKEKYENVIIKIKQIYPKAKIHIFCWTDPNLNINKENVILHISNTGELFLDDFNSLVHADILLIGSSTFSISAGFFCKGVVMYDSSFCNLKATPVPNQWNMNYINFFNKINN